MQALQKLLGSGSSSGLVKFAAKLAPEDGDDEAVKELKEKSLTVLAKAYKCVVDLKEVDQTRQDVNEIASGANLTEDIRAAMDGVIRTVDELEQLGGQRM